MKKELDLFPSPYGVVSFNLRFQNICMTDMIGFPSPYGVVSFNLSEFGIGTDDAFLSFPSPYGVVSFNPLENRSTNENGSKVSVPLRGSQFQSKIRRKAFYRRFIMRFRPLTG